MKPINLWSLPMSNNDVTGDALRTKLGSKEQQEKFSEGFDRIFSKKKKTVDWDENRIDTIGQNGNDGLHYEANDK